MGKADVTDDFRREIGGENLASLKAAGHRL